MVLYVPCVMTGTQAGPSEPSPNVLCLKLSCPLGHKCPQAMKREMTHSPGTVEASTQPVPKPQPQDRFKDTQRDTLHHSVQAQKSPDGGYLVTYLLDT